MKIPFTIEQFLEVFEYYNLSIWPFQIFLYFLASVMIFLAWRKQTHSDKIIVTLLAFFWFWMGIVYHLIHFSSINKAAYIFGILFIIQGFLFLYSGLLRNRLIFKYQNNIFGMMGTFFMLYALVIYPLWGHYSGHVFPKIPLLGVPCPTTIFTFGILLWTERKINKFILIIPFLWSIVGFSAAVHLNIKEDFGLFVAGLLGTILLVIRDRSLDSSSS